MRHSFLKMATLAFIALGFVACESDSVGGIKKPLVYKNFDKQLKPYYVIQSQDDNTIIEDYVVNRGNCGNKGLQKYGLNDEYSKASKVDCVINSGGFITACIAKFCVNDKNKDLTLEGDGWRLISEDDVKLENNPLSSLKDLL